MFVELANTIEGLVHVSYLTDDYYHYDERHYAMIGERTGNVFRIGEEITVRVINVNKEERDIDFEIVGMKNNRRTNEENSQNRRIVKLKKGHRSSHKTGSNQRPKRSAEDGWSTSKPTRKKKKKTYENSPAQHRKN